MYRFIYLSIVICSLAVTISSCGGGKDEPEQNPSSSTSTTDLDKIALSIQPQAPSDYNGSIGVYAVRNNGAEQGVLLTANNYIDNGKLTFSSGKWIGEKWYWPNDSTHMDFYCYGPYKADITDVSAVPFSVSENQSAGANENFYWGMATGISPSSASVNVKMDKLTSTIKIQLKSNDYSEEDLQSAEIEICGLRNSATINLANGMVSTLGNTANIIPYGKGVNREATVLPQSVSGTDLIVVTFDSKQQTLSDSLAIEPGKVYTFEILVEKTKDGIVISLSSWDIVDKDFGGTI